MVSRSYDDSSRPASGSPRPGRAPPRTTGWPRRTRATDGVGTNQRTQHTPPCRQSPLPATTIFSRRDSGVLVSEALSAPRWRRQDRPRPLLACQPTFRPHLSARPAPSTLAFQISPLLVVCASIAVGLSFHFHPDRGLHPIASSSKPLAPRAGPRPLAS